MLDALHIVRGGSSLDDVRAPEAHLVPVVQLCDGPRSRHDRHRRPAARGAHRARRDRHGQ